MFEVKQLCGQLCLGKQGENLARIVYFDEPSLWKEKFGEGKCELLHQRNGDAAPYPVLLETEDGKVCWKITNADTANVGEGKCELYYSVDGVVVKSKIWATNVFPSLGENIVEPPKEYQAWVDEVLGAAAKVEDATRHNPVIGENKNWFIWDVESEQYVDTGVCAEGLAPDMSNKEDKSNKMNSWDDLGDDDGSNKYPSLNMLMQVASDTQNSAEGNANSYTDMKVREVSDRVTTNEQSIAGAFDAIQSNESNIQGIHDQLVKQDELIDQNVNRIIDLENNMGDVETALDNIIAIQNSLIGGDA